MRRCDRDPRARQFLRTTAQRTDLPDELQAVARFAALDGIM